MSDEPKERVMTFRVTEEEYLKIDECGFRGGRSANEWCRDLAVSESGKDFGMTANERILIEEIAVLRKMVGVALKCLLSPEELNELREKLNENYAEYGRQVLAKRSAGRPDQTLEGTFEGTVEKA
jgi:hypothetical protein